MGVAAQKVNQNLPNLGGASAHNPYFDFNDEILPLAASVMAATAEKRLRKLNGGGDSVN